ncbi:MAG: DUF1211 domain-containing protein [Candidatus Omnitrophica bacterium]|nr:DUF1211 domain-containing protein [Candidatus Omnitrophota bacterium]
MDAASDEKETGRLEAFSDGVFSIAITLLVLQFKIPKLDQLGAEAHLSGALLSEWPSYMAYFISFFTILVMWVNHHRLFNHIKRVDNLFLFINGFLLMLVAFVPFPTQLLAEHIRHRYAVTATAFFTGTYILIAVAFNALWHYAIYRRRLLGRSANAAAVDRITQNYRLGPCGFSLAFILAFFNVALSLTAFTALAFFYAFTGEGK